MNFTPMSYTNSSIFLLTHSGIYQYHPKMRLGLGIFGIVIVLGCAIMAFEVFALGETVTLKEIPFLILGPWAIWSVFSSALRFRTLEFSEEGIKVHPLGFHISSEAIEEISFKENNWGARAIELRLGTHRCILHLFVCSIGKRAWIAFGDRLFLPKDGA